MSEETNETNETNERTTLLFNQQGIKAVVLNEGTITVHYVDGSDPIYVHEGDKLYYFHLNNFQKIVEGNLNPKEETTKKVD